MFEEAKSFLLSRVTGLEVVQKYCALICKLLKIDDWEKPDD